MRSSALVLLALAACNTAPEDPVTVSAAVEAPPPPPKVERAPAGVPHGGFITHLAITEEGDAVVSVDTVGGLRLWPALDGTREPIPFSVNGAEAVAIAHAGDELLVAVLDQAGAVQLLRFSQLGILRGRAQVPGETTVTQLVAIERGVLVARDDGTIERYDATGALRGRIATEPGQYLGGLAARHGMAAVLIGNRKTEERPAEAALEEIERPARRAKILVSTESASALRWIRIGSELAWGGSVALPEKLDDRVLALSPNLKRIALIAQTSELQIYDVAKEPVLVAGPKTWASVGSMVGFLDDDHAVWINGLTRWWTATAHAPATVTMPDPWHVETGLSEEGVNSDGGAVGGDRVVSGVGPDLVIQTLHDTRYLGWRDVAVGNVVVSGAHVGLETANRHILWLDRALGRESEVDLDDLGYANTTAAWWIDPNHAVIRKGGDKVTVELVDFRHKDQHVALGTFTYMRQVEWLPALHELALVDDSLVRRFTLDLEHDQVTELPPLDAPASLSYVRLLDPATADGVIAIAVGYDEEGQRTTYYREGAGKKLKGKKAKPLSGGLAGIGRDGTLYLRLAGTLSTWKDGKQVLKWPDGTDADSITADARNERLVGIHGSAVTLYDSQGKVVWTQNVWGAQTAMFTLDGQIVLRTTGGLLALDAATGARTAAACGFSFGVMTKTPRANALNVQPVCEDLGT